MLGFKVYKTVIMDGSSKFVNKEITGLMEMVTNKKIGRIKCKSLDRKHPTMKVFKRFTSAERYREAKQLIESYYPGLCTFNAVM